MRSRGNRTKTIYIIGAGAIGKALAVFLKLRKRGVKLIRASVDNVETSTEMITVLNRETEKLASEISVMSLTKLKVIDGVVIVTTKTFANETLATKLKEKGGQFSIVVMQNGLNIESPFIEAGFKSVYRCVLFSTSQVQPNGQVSFKSVSPSPIGAILGTPFELEEIVKQINTPEFIFRSEENISRITWEKVIVNCAFNSICPLLETDNGIFYRNERVYRLAKKIIGECLTIAKEYGIELDEQAVCERLLLISKKAEGQLISTYQDIKNRRRTEIDSLNLEIGRLAMNVGKPEIVQFTKFLGDLISIKSEWDVETQFRKKLV